MPLREVLIEKQWAGKVKRTVCDVFWEYVAREPEKVVPPVISTPRQYLISVTRFDLTFLTTTQKETPPLLVLEMQHRIVDTFLAYFDKKLSDTIIKENFSTVYQLLDEVCQPSWPSRAAWGSNLVLLITLVIGGDEYSVCLVDDRWRVSVYNRKQPAQRNDLATFYFEQNSSKVVR